MFDEGTSVKGMVTKAPPHVPVSARRRADAIVMIKINATSAAARYFICLVFIYLLLHIFVEMLR
jgi:hypothetical protein